MSQEKHAHWDVLDMLYGKRQPILPSVSTFTTAASAFSVPAFNNSALDNSPFNNSASVPACGHLGPHFPSTIIEIRHYPADPHTAFGIALCHYIYVHAIFMPMLAVFPHRIPPYQLAHLAPTAS